MIDSMNAIVIPTVGYSKRQMNSHAWDSGLGTLYEVETRKLLAENLKALMSKRPDLDTLKKITAASDGRLSNGKLDRIRRASHTTDLESLADLAGVFGLQPWQLLVENLNPEALPLLIGAEVSSQMHQIAAQEVAKLLTPLAAQPVDRKQIGDTKEAAVGKNSGLLGRLRRLDTGGKDEGSKPARTPKPRRGGRS